MTDASLFNAMPAACRHQKTRDQNRIGRTEHTNGNLSSYQCHFYKKGWRTKAFQQEKGSSILDIVMNPIVQKNNFDALINWRFRA